MPDLHALLALRSGEGASVAVADIAAAAQTTAAVLKVGCLLAQVLDRDDLRGPYRVGVWIIHHPDAASGLVTAVVDHLTRNVRVPAHAAEQSSGGFPDRDLFVPTQEVQLAQEDHEGDERAGQHAGDQGAQHGSARRTAMSPRSRWGGRARP